MSDDRDIFDGFLGGVWKFFNTLFWLAVAVFVIGAVVVTLGGG